jgi:L-fuconolactonase
MRVDAQVHVVSPDRERYPLSPGPEFAGPGPQWFDRPRISVEDCLADLDAANVERAVLVQPHSAYQYDNSYTADAAAAYRDRLAWTCVVDTGSACSERIRYWGLERGARAVRILLRLTGPDWLGSQAGDEVLREISRCGLVAQIVLPFGTLGRLRQVADRYQEVPILVDHCAMPDLSGGEGFPHAGALFGLAESPNVSVKLSSHVFRLAREGGSTPDRITRRLVDHFGGSRVLWASDYSVYDKEYPPYLTEAEAACSTLAPVDRAQVLGDAAAAMWWPE